MLATQMAEFVSSTKPDRIPQAVFDRTIDLCISALGSAILGATTAIPVKLATQIRAQGAAAKASAIGLAFGTSVELAAMLNSTSSHATEYEDVSWPEGQYTNCLIPAMFALGEALDASGFAVLEAIVLGFEVASRPATVTAMMSRGFLNSACMGTLGVAAGAARLMRLDAEATERAITMAASMASGLFRQAGSTAHVLEAGLAARNGISAASLAASGFGGSTAIFDGPRGFFDCYAGNPDPVFELGGGGDFRIMAVGQKKYPCGYKMQRILDGVFGIIQDHALSSDDIAEVAVHVNGAFTQSVKFAFPATGEEGRLSLFHTISAAMAWGAVDHRAFSDAAVADPLLLAERRRIRLVEHPEWGADMIGASDLVEIRTVSGAVHERLCKVAHGDGVDPLSRQETLEKFRFCTGSVLATEAQEALASRLAAVQQLPSVAPLLRAMTDLRVSVLATAN